MRPIQIRNQIKLPVPTRAGKLVVGDVFRINEKAALQLVVDKNVNVVISKNLFGHNFGKSKTTLGYPVIQYI